MENDGRQLWLPARHDLAVPVRHLECAGLADPLVDDRRAQTGEAVAWMVALARVPEVADQRLRMQIEQLPVADGEEQRVVGPGAAIGIAEGVARIPRLCREDRAVGVPREPLAERRLHDRRALERTIDFGADDAERPGLCREGLIRTIIQHQAAFEACARDAERRGTAGMDEHGIAERAGAHGHGHATDRVVRHLMPVYDPIRIRPRLAVDLDRDHELVGAERCGLRRIELWSIEAGNPVFGGSSVAEQLQVDTRILRGVDALPAELAKFLRLVSQELLEGAQAQWQVCPEGVEIGRRAGGSTEPHERKGEDEPGPLHGILQVSVYPYGLLLGGTTRGTEIFPCVPKTCSTHNLPNSAPPRFYHLQGIEGAPGRHEGWNIR